MPPVLPSEDEVASLVPDPGSPVWRHGSDVRLFAAAGYALLLQVAHPTVGAGVADYSDFAADPWGRLLRTLDYVNGTIYGGPRLAGEIGRRVRELHTQIKGVRPDGVPYHSLEPRAYAWVHATLASAIVDGHRVLGRPMSRAEVEAFWDDWRRLGRLIGVRDDDLPGDWAGFRTYFDEMVSTDLEDNPTVHLVLRTLLRPVAPPLPGMHPRVWRVLRRPLARPLYLSTVGLLPGELRHRLNIPWSQREDSAFRALAAVSRASTPLVVGPLRQLGPTYLKWRRPALVRGEVASPKIAERIGSAA